MTKLIEEAAALALAGVGGGHFGGGWFAGGERLLRGARARCGVVDRAVVDLGLLAAGGGDGVVWWLLWDYWLLAVVSGSGSSRIENTVESRR